MLPVHRVEVQGEFVLREGVGGRMMDQKDLGKRGGAARLCHLTLREARSPTAVWVTICPSGPTARWVTAAGSELSAGGRRDFMKRPRRMVWMMMEPS